MIVPELKPNLPAMFFLDDSNPGRRPIPITLTDSVQVALALPHGCPVISLVWLLFWPKT